MGVIRVIDHSGTAHQLDAVEGWRVMEIIREHAIDIEALCGGACACATCHVVGVPDGGIRLHLAHDEDESMLDSLPVVAATSRPSCQIIYQAALVGLALRLGKTG